MSYQLIYLFQVSGCYSPIPLLDQGEVLRLRTLGDGDGWIMVEHEDAAGPEDLGCDDVHVGHLIRVKCDDGCGAMLAPLLVI